MRAMKNILGLSLLVLLAVGARAQSDAGFASALNAGGRTLLAQASFSSSNSEEQDLLDALNDNKPEVRVQAFKGLKRFVNFSDKARGTALAHLGYITEDASVRAEAARALSAAVADSNVRDALRKHAKDRSNPAAVRAMAYKALYWQTQYDSDVRREALDAAKRESDGAVRLAAIWSLMYAGGDADVRRDLLDLAKNGSSDAVRREAAKSLYSEMSDADVRQFARDAAKSGSGEARYAAIMMLSTRMFEEDARLLEDISKNDSDPQARRYAVTAIAAPVVEVVYFFHQNHYQWVGRTRRLISEALDRE